MEIYITLIYNILTFFASSKITSGKSLQKIAHEIERLK